MTLFFSNIYIGGKSITFKEILKKEKKGNSQTGELPKCDTIYKFSLCWKNFVE